MQLLTERIKAILSTAMASLQMNPNDIAQILDVVEVDGLADMFINLDQHFRVSVGMKVCSRSEEFCRSQQHIAQVVCSKMKVAVFVSRGRNGLISFSLKYSKQKLEQDPTAILIKFQNYVDGFRTQTHLESLIETYSENFEHQHSDLIVDSLTHIMTLQKLIKIKQTHERMHHGASVVLNDNCNRVQQRSLMISSLVNAGIEETCNKYECQRDHRISLKTIKLVKQFQKKHEHIKAECRAKLTDLISDIKKEEHHVDKFSVLEKKLQDQKLYLNMVVHDLRNPTESIHDGLEFLKKKCSRIIEEVIGESVRFIDLQIQDCSPVSKSTFKQSRKSGQRPNKQSPFEFFDAENKPFEIAMMPLNIKHKTHSHKSEKQPAKAIFNDKILQTDRSYNMVCATEED